MLNSKKQALEALDRAMQLSLEVPCDCDRSLVDVCAGRCVGARIAEEVQLARKFFRNYNTPHWLKEK